MLNEGRKLSRDCIYDTLIAKRTGIFKQGGFVAALCQLNLQILRKDQLAPHKETKMVASRYRMRQLMKKIQAYRHAPVECPICYKAFVPEEYVNQADNHSIQILANEDMFLCSSCLAFVLSESADDSHNEAVILMEDGLVQSLVIPEGCIEGFVVADHDVFEGGDEDEMRYYMVNLIAANRLGMRFV